MARKINALMNIAVTAKNDTSGVEHDISLGYYVGEEFVLIIHAVYAIPAARMEEELSNGTVSERVVKYKNLILEYLGHPGTVLEIPPAPAAPDSIVVYSVANIEAYIDALEAYQIALQSYLDNEYADYLAEFAARNALAETWATTASNFVEGRADFEGYPYPFSVQVG